MSWLQNGIQARILTRTVVTFKPRQANACLLKVAQFAGTLEDYERAIEVFERVASKSLENNLTKWSVREYLFKCMICVLCLEVMQF
jgi:Soluble NSF attachment protein, SNAP